MVVTGVHRAGKHKSDEVGPSRRGVLRATALASGAVALSPAWAHAAFATSGDVAGPLPAWAKTYAPKVSGPFDPATGIFNWRPSGPSANVARTVGSLTGAFSADQHHLFIGDSISSGWNSLSALGYGVIDRDKSWPYYYRRALTSSLGLPEGGTGLVRATEINSLPNGTSMFDERWSPGPNGITVQNKGHFIVITNATVVFDSAQAKFQPVSGDSIGVMYIDSGTFQVSIDNGPYVNVVGGQSGAVKRYSVTGLPMKPHRVSIRAAFGINAQIVGAEVYQRRGISAHDVAQGGSGVTGNAQPDWSWPATGKADASMSMCFAAASGYASAPSTTFICLGGNDINANKNNLGAIRDGIAKTAGFYKGKSDIVVVAECHGSQAFSTVDIKPLLGMLYQLCFENNWPLWDLEQFLGGYEKLAAQGLTGDTYGHLKPVGYELIGKAMASIVAGSLS